MFYLQLNRTFLSTFRKGTKWMGEFLLANCCLFICQLWTHRIWLKAKVLTYVKPIQKGASAYYMYGGVGKFIEKPSFFETHYSQLSWRLISCKEISITVNGLQTKSHLSKKTFAIRLVLHFLPHYCTMGQLSSLSRKF